MLVCEDVQTDAQNPLKVNVFGLVSTIRSLADPPFPLLYPQLCVYLVLTGGRGSGDALIAAVEANSEDLVFSTPVHPLSFGADPLATRGVIFRILDCTFSQPGLYWIEFRYNNRTLARQPLLVR
jgi:hypothetical protein